MQTTTNKLPATIVVVMLRQVSAYGDTIPEGKVLEVDRAVRHDWKGSGLCRDATEEEIARYRAEEGGGDELVDLEEQIERLQERKTELAGDLQALESDLATFGKQRDELQVDLEGLGKKKAELAAEVAALEKAKKAASK